MKPRFPLTMSVLILILMNGLKAAMRGTRTTDPLFEVSIILESMTSQG